MPGKKEKPNSSKGGSSFLTIKSAETDSVSLQKESNIQKKASERPRRRIKTEEEKIEDFANSVSKFLDKIENIRMIFLVFVQKKYPEAVEKLKIMTLKGKFKFLKPILPALIIIQQINEKWFNKNFSHDEGDEKEEKEQKPAEPKKPITFLELAEKNIIFTDNKKRPLYTLDQLKDKSGYVASESVITPMVMENIINAFNEVAPKARAIPTPEIGKYAGITMSEVMANITDQDIIEFLEYVRNFPRGYVGKNYRITESFAGWAVSGTPDN